MKTVNNIKKKIETWANKSKYDIYSWAQQIKNKKMGKDEL
jgi:hypothetical protein